ncbi:speckle-type POZ protein-like [Chrysoperla carnea]|uniref:speckle-type POZ protein-like n=1 Tax=Chrysoperla carnea TaxID=189513 RepID=UPI001D07AAE0|nr:speckle-type POZ protein-like [Chrysoperla carnea]
MDHAGITNLKKNKFSYLWTINNVTAFLQPKLAFDEGLVSPTFTKGNNNNLAWSLKITKYMEIQRRFEDNQQKFDCLTFAIKLVSSYKTKTPAVYKLSFVNDKEELITKVENGYEFGIGFEANIYSTNVSAILNKQNGLISDDKFKIFCQISVIEIVTGDTIESIIKVPKCRIIDDLEILFETKKFCDATLSVADGKEFQVHKTILAARSPIFAAMFDHEMEERKLNRVNITDIEYDILHELLKFIYTGKVDNLQTMASELLAAADKYALERLKILCEKELCRNLSIENAAETLIFADLHGANQLKAQAINFINNNPKVAATVGWKKLKETYSHLITDVYEELLTLRIL